MSTFSKFRVGPKGVVAGVPILQYTTPAFDATVAAAATIAMPSDAVICGVGSIVGTLDAVGDTIDVGTTDGGEEIKSELIAGVTTAMENLVDVPLVDGNLYVSVGATSIGTAGGTAQLVIQYYIADALEGVNN